MSRGRLIFPKLVEVARFDGAAVEAAGGFDRSMREIRVRNPNTATSQRVTDRQETLVRVRAQVETDSFERLMMGGLGNAASSRITLVFFAPELEELELLDATTRKPLFKNTDRLAAIYELDETLIQQIPNPPGLFAVHTNPVGFGFGRGGYNLVEQVFESRPRGPTGGAG